MNAIVNAKHWQLFLIIIVLPIAILIPQISKTIAHLETKGDAQVVETIMHIKYMPLIWSLIGILFLLWLYSIMNAVRKENQHFEFPSKFNLVVYYCIAYLCILGIMLFNTFSKKEFYPELVIYMIVPTIIYALCFIYILYKTSRTLVDQKHTTNFVLTLILILLYPVGIWLLQPKINKIRSQ